MGSHDLSLCGLKWYLPQRNKVRRLRLHDSHPCATNPESTAGKEFRELAVPQDVSSFGNIHSIS
jgi:hypothetical protein